MDMRQKTFFYIVDKLTETKAESFKAALGSVPNIQSITVRPAESLVEVIATGKVDDQVRVACDAAGLTYRTRVKKRR